METKNKKQSAGFTPPHFSQGKLFDLTNSQNNDSLKDRGRPLKSGAGFTLIELLVVIAIIGLLASVILVALNSTRAKSRDAKRVQDLNQLGKAFELYFNSNFTYPTLSSSGALTNLVGAPPLTPTYLVKMPATVLPADGTCGAGPGNGTNDYYFYANSGGGTYTLTFCLGNATGSLGAGPHTLTQAGFQ